MNRLVRNLSIHVTVIAALLSFAALISLVAALSMLSDRNADRVMADLNRISMQQLNEINRGDALLNVARVSLEIASNQIMLGRMAEANRQLDVALDRLQQAEERLNHFIAAPKTKSAEALAVPSSTASAPSWRCRASSTRRSTSSTRRASAACATASWCRARRWTRA